MRLERDTDRGNIKKNKYVKREMRMNHERVVCMQKKRRREKERERKDERGSNKRILSKEARKRKYFFFSFLYNFPKNYDCELGHTWQQLDGFEKGRENETEF